MDKDYLWDRSGEADPEIEKLENVLGRLRYNRAAAVFPEIPVRVRKSILARLFHVPWAPAAAVALLVIIIAAVGWVLRPKQVALGPAWNVTKIAGTPRLESKPFHANGGTAKLRLVLNLRQIVNRGLTCS